MSVLAGRGISVTPLDLDLTHEPTLATLRPLFS
jgi:hypothetical protein